MNPESRPKALLAMESPQLAADLFGTRARRDLDRVVDVHESVLTPDLPAVPASTADTEILITGWGAPRLDEAVLAHWPRLRAVVHAAGSVKRLVTAGGLGTRHPRVQRRRRERRPRRGVHPRDDPAQRG